MAKVLKCNLFYQPSEVSTELMPPPEQGKVLTSTQEQYSSSEAAVQESAAVEQTEEPLGKPQ